MVRWERAKRGAGEGAPCFKDDACLVGVRIRHLDVCASTGNGQGKGKGQEAGDDDSTVDDVDCGQADAKVEDKDEFLVDLLWVDFQESCLQASGGRDIAGGAGNRDTTPATTGD